MAKNIIKLTEEEFYKLVKNAVNESIDEIDGRTYARIHNATIKAQQNQVNGHTNSNPRKTNMDVITQGILLDPKAADSLITPFKDTYVFHCTNLRGTASLTVFTLEELYSLSKEKVILKGTVVFNGTQLHGSIIVDMNNMSVYYNYKGQKPSYKLTIDPNNKTQWDNLISQLVLSINSRTV